MKKIFLLAAVLFACISASHAQNVTDTFPGDFGKGKTYLYVVTVPGYFQVNNALKKIMEKEYGGDYEVIDVREFTTVPKKANVKTYAFAMIYDNQEGYFGSEGRVGPETNYSCGVRDMATGKLYRLPYVGGNYNKVIKKYVNRLEEIRKANEGTK
jgi:hypothetical protein